jgi:alkylation response protein AidB-like acyl-CoA dehydrogenase
MGEWRHAVSIDTIYEPRGRMDFSLSSEQQALQHSVRGVLSDCCSLEQIRRFAEGDAAIAAHAWEGLSALGVPAILVPEEFGGLGMGLLDAALVSEALGAHAAPSVFLGSALAALALREIGPASQQARFLSGLAAGRLNGAVALAEGISGARDGAGLGWDGAALNGTALFTIGTDAPGVIIGATAGKALYVLDGAASGISFVPMPSIDRTQRLGELHCDRAPAEVLPGSNVMTAAQGFARVRDAAWVLLAADMLGASQTMLDRAVTYAKERVQFGRTIGSFQAVKHLCAEMAAKLEPCRALVWYAAHAFDEGLEDAPLAAAHAKAHLSEVSRFVARTATEVHGGMGFTDLLGLHYWFKRVGLDRQLLGGPEQVRRHAATLQRARLAGD